MPETDPGWSAVHETYSSRGLTDSTAPVQASSEIVIAAAPEAVWAVLADITRWPEIRADIGDVNMEGPAAPSSLFHWSTQGVGLVSRFGVVVPAREVTWSTTTTGMVMTVRYLLERRGDGSTLLQCHEALAAPNYPQLGGNAELRARIESWLQGIKAVAERNAD